MEGSAWGAISGVGAAVALKLLEYLVQRGKDAREAKIAGGRLSIEEREQALREKADERDDYRWLLADARKERDDARGERDEAEAECRRLEHLLATAAAQKQEDDQARLLMLQAVGIWADRVRAAEREGALLRDMLERAGRPAGELGDGS